MASHATTTDIILYLAKVVCVAHQSEFNTPLLVAHYSCVASLVCYAHYRFYNVGFCLRLGCVC
jgi:hypothetical protein